MACFNNFDSFQSHSVQPPNYIWHKIGSRYMQKKAIVHRERWFGSMKDVIQLWFYYCYCYCLLVLLFTTLSVAGEFVKHFTRCRSTFSSFFISCKLKFVEKESNAIVEWEIIDKYSISGCNGRSSLYIALIIMFLLQFCVRNVYALHILCSAIAMISFAHNINVMSTKNFWSCWESIFGSFYLFVLAILDLQ